MSLDNLYTLNIIILIKKSCRLFFIALIFFSALYSSSVERCPNTAVFFPRKFDSPLVLTHLMTNAWNDPRVWNKIQRQRRKKSINFVLIFILQLILKILSGIIVCYFKQLHKGLSLQYWGELHSDINVAPTRTYLVCLVIFLLNK